MKTKSKRSKKSGRSTRLISIKKLQKQCEELWKEIIRKRDGSVCMVQKTFPEICIKHSKVYQADHCFTRKNKYLFLLPENGTMVCSSCNQVKGFGLKSISRAIDDIVIEREGMEVFKKMYTLDRASKPCTEWSNRDWLEDNLKRLKGVYETYSGVSKVCKDSRAD